MATIPRQTGPKKPSSLMVRLDEKSKKLLKRAAELRRMSVSDYVRTITVSQAEREVRAARSGIIVMTPAEQLEEIATLAQHLHLEQQDHWQTQREELFAKNVVIHDLKALQSLLEHSG